MCGDSYWGITDALVACRQLGLSTTGANLISVSAIPEDNRVSWLRNVGCTGTESSLFYCNVRLSEVICYNSGYAGVSCQDSKS